MISEMFQNASLFAKASLFMGIVPLAMGVVYAVWPSEQRLALMRPLSLSAIFAAISGTVLGLVNILLYVGTTDPPQFSRVAMVGLSEALVPVFFGFGCLTVAWLCVALGLWRRP